MHLTEFNALDAADAADVVGVWAAIPAWIETIVSARPFASVDDLVEVAADSATTWTRTDLDAALVHHPRIGERVGGATAEAAASRVEQASMTDAGADVARRMAAGNRAYEERFGRVFLIRAAGRSPEEMLAELDRRLASDDEDDAREALRQLGEIALLRLRTTIGEPS